MTMHVDLSGVQNRYRLCFVRDTWAFFTRLALDRQWGDNWERTPYERYAGAPYAGEPDQILKLAFDGPLLRPEAGTHGAAYSVEEINNGRVPWLRTESYLGTKQVFIMAGVTLEKFVPSVELAGGTVYVPLGWGDLIRRTGAIAPETPERSP
ncbi:hypothetical protein [Paraburkholderia adhaesiva]|uniref:hypothetical protein n=1 Tax=Paraburkholderia adhaesiva TaxID=2883244 RepID=UPI001F298514|nr:hypothetical protein [Paraburkholderia adhaesiva]